MKHTIFKYVAVAAVLLATAMNAEAQYNTEGGVSTYKQVTGPDTDGYYTLRLETFATGTTTVTDVSTPVDVVLVLDVSRSMSASRGTITQLSSNSTLSYNDVVNSETNYLFKRSGGQGPGQSTSYNQIFGQYYNGNYYLYIAPTGNTYYYLTANGGTVEKKDSDGNPTPPSGAASSNTADGNIVTSTNSNFYTGSSRINDLQEAVNAFIDEINKNDLYDKKGNARSSRLGNRIAIVTFASNATTVSELTSLTDNGSALKSSVNSFILAQGTNSGNGMINANDILSGIGSDRESSRVVVMFTDGTPNDQYAAIGEAYKTKNTYSASVFTVGLFDTSPDTNSATYKYMNYVSSNFPNATNYSTPGEGDTSAGYYKDASEENADLTSIFVSIAQSSAQADATVGSSTQVRDVVTNAFVLPDNVSAADVTVYKSKATGTGTGAEDEEPSWATAEDITNSVTIKIVKVDENGDPIADDDNTTTAKNKALIVEGFDYSLKDSSEGAGDGNWVGQRYKNGSWTWAGYKLIITFKVLADPEATGGETQTNMESSGVYIKNENGTYTCINNYKQPHTTLSVNIKIKKKGLRSGESATFVLMKIRPKNWVEDGDLQTNIANIEYNIIGKPKPGVNDYDGPLTAKDGSAYYKALGWKNFNKVILTNKSTTDGAEVTKMVLALDPYWVYMVREDDWGWSYTMEGDTNQVGEDGTYTTSSVEVNPFNFKNTEKTNVVKHAEAIMINHFKQGVDTENYKSSKVESFTTPTN